MSRAIKQATLNEHVNLEAVRHYVDHLCRNRASIEGIWWEGHEGEQARAELKLTNAIALFQQAIAVAHEAEMSASDFAYAHLYRADGPMHRVPPKK